MNWARVRDSSRVMQVLSSAQSDSLVVGALRRLVVRMPILTRDIQRPDADFNEHRVRLVFETNVIVGTAAALLARSKRAWRHSRSGSIVSSVLDRLTTVDVAGRVRLAALTLLTAVIVHLLLTRFSAPEPTTIARVTWTVIASMLWLVMIGADSIAVAWADWSTRRNHEGSDRR